MFTVLLPCMETTSNLQCILGCVSVLVHELVKMIGLVGIVFGRGLTGCVLVYGVTIGAVEPSSNKSSSCN